MAITIPGGLTRDGRTGQYKNAKGEVIDVYKLKNGVEMVHMGPDEFLKQRTATKRRNVLALPELPSEEAKAPVTGGIVFDDVAMPDIAATE
jgi:hypothetical protein